MTCGARNLLEEYLMPVLSSYSKAVKLHFGGEEYCPLRQSQPFGSGHNVRWQKDGGDKGFW